MEELQEKRVDEGPCVKKIRTLVSVRVVVVWVFVILV